MNLHNKIVALTLILVLWGGNTYAQQSSFTRQDKTVIINKVIDLLKENYIYPDRVGVIENYIKVKLKTGGYDSLHIPQDFLKSLNFDMEQKGNDSHVNIFYGPDRVKQIIADNKNAKEGKPEKIASEFLQRLQFENFRLRKLERLDGNIGYFEFLNFTPLSVSKQSLKGAMNFLLYSSAIIIDLRGNGGGYSETMDYLLSYFFNDSVPISEMRYRRENKVARTVILKDSSINKFPNNTPVYILVSNRTSSAAEAFASKLQRYNRAIVIGEQTKGEGNPGSLFAINDVLYIMIPTAESIDPVTKKGIDFKGVIPDIKIERDKALTKALLEASLALAAKADRDDLRRMYQWQIPLLNNRLTPQPLTETIIKSIVGDYEGNRKIIYEAPDIFYISNKGEKEKLNYIGNGTFQNAQKDWVRLVMPFTDKSVPDFDWVYDDSDKPQKVKRVVK